MGKTITTVGHSNHGPDEFAALLQGAGVDHVVDVRSRPYSRYAPHFNLSTLRALLADHGIAYSHAAPLGGRPEEPDMYDSAGHVLYGKVAQSDEFERAVERLEDLARSSTLAVMCGEEDPTECHRRLLVGRVLVDRGWNVVHLRGDGRLMSESQLADVIGTVEPGLFEGGEFSAWRSIRSVSHKDQRRTSSEP